MSGRELCISFVQRFASIERTKTVPFGREKGQGFEIVAVKADRKGLCFGDWLVEG